MNQIIGLDFSIKKPAACIYANNSYTFLSWPLGLKESLVDSYKDAGVYIIDREVIDTKIQDSSEKMRKDLENSMYLSELIVNSLASFVDLKQCFIAFEGLSFGSSGNVILQLSSYKYILMKAFYDKGVKLSNMFTFAPITIKKAAGCSQKGMGKKEMIDAFAGSDNDIPFRKFLDTNRLLFQKKGGNWVDHLDDLVDSYFVIKTFQEKAQLQNVNFNKI